MHLATSQEHAKVTGKGSTASAVAFTDELTKDSFQREIDEANMRLVKRKTQKKRPKNPPQQSTSNEEMPG